MIYTSCAPRHKDLAVIHPVVRYLLLSLSLCIAAPAGADVKYLYRYTDQKGQIVIDDNVPPQAVARGYVVLRLDGTVVREVPRQLSDEELKSRSSEEAQQRLLEEERERLRRWDESLLRRYSSIADIEAARERELRSIQVRISILRSNLNSVKLQIERDQGRAAELERTGREVPEALAENIEKSLREVADTEYAIEQRREEIDQVTALYQRDIERFKTLLEAVEARRQRNAGSKSSSASKTRPY